MRVSKKGRDLIKHFEGYSETAYLCQAGVWTIGWGNTFIQGRPVKKGDRVELQQANKAFREYLTSQVVPVISRLVKVDLTQNQFDALASFIYNIGAGAFSQSTMLNLLNQGKFLEASDQFNRWIYAGRMVSEGLLRRRQSEKHLFLTGGLKYEH